MLANGEELIRSLRVYFLSPSPFSPMLFEGLVDIVQPGIWYICPRMSNISRVYNVGVNY